MRKPLWLALLVIAVFIAAWYWTASTLPSFMDEPEDLGISKGIALKGIPSTGGWPSWNFDESRFVYIDLDRIRGALLCIACSFAFKGTGDPVFLSRLVPLASTLLTFLIMVWYYQRRGILTAGRFLIWTILYFTSYMVLENAFYIHFYSLLATFMTAAFICYWEGLVALQKRKPAVTLLLWLLGFGLFWVTVADGWQYQQIPILGAAIVLSFLAFHPSGQPLFRWLQKYALALGIAFIVAAPIVTMALNIIPIPLKNASIQRWLITYWDNIVGFLRFVIAVNAGLLALAYAFKNEKPLTFDRWMFICGIFGVIISSLYNPSNQVFFSRYVYFPTVMVIIGLSGMLPEVFAQASARNRILAVYAAINIAATFANLRYEHSNIRQAVKWLNSHISAEDVLLGIEPMLPLNGGQKLVPQLLLLYPSNSQTQVQVVMDHVRSHPGGRIFYLYNDGYGFRNWLYKATTGGTRYPGSDLFMYLRKRIPGKEVMPGLRQCGLIEFDHRTLLDGLNRLSREGFDPDFKAPEKIWIKSWLKRLNISAVK